MKTHHAIAAEAISARGEKHSDKQKIGLMYISGNLGYGGQERQLLYLLRQLDQQQFSLTIVIWNYEDGQRHFAEEIAKLGVDIRLFNIQTSSLTKLLSFRKIIRKKKPVLVHSYEFSKNIYACLATLGISSTAIGALRSSYWFNLTSGGRLVTYLNGMLPLNIISNNYRGLQELKEFFPKVVPRKLMVLRNKLELSQFQVHSLPSTDMIQTVSVGRLGPEKRVDMIIDTVAKLVEKGLNIVHRHAGRGVLRDKLQRQIQEKKIQKHFTLIGETDDINSFIGSAHFFMHAAASEGMPNVLMEAMACGRAVLTTDCGDSAIMIENEIHGFVVDQGDFDAYLERALLLSNDLELCKRLGKEARAKAEKEFGIETLIPEIMELYQKKLQIKLQS